MANNSPTIVAASLDDEKLKKSIEQMVQNLNDGLKKMKKSTDEAVAYMQKSLQKLGNTKVDSGSATDGGSSKRAKHQNEETDAVQKTTAARKEYNATLDQTAQATQSAAAAGKKYSDEIIRQANAIRATKEWQEKGQYMIGNDRYFDSSRANASKRDRQIMGSLEEQILRTVEKRQVAEENLILAQKIENENIRKAKEEEEKRKLAEEQRLGIVKQITAEQEKQKKNYTSPSISEIDVNRDFMKKFLSQRLGVAQNKIINWDEEKNSANTLTNALKQLQTAYSKLNSYERSSGIGKQIVSDIQVLERAIQRIKQEASRPVDLGAVLGIKPKTLDDMAYKLRQLQSYKMGLDLNSSKATSEIRQIDNEINRLKKDMDKYMSTGREVNSMNNALGRSWNYMKNRLAFYFTVGASTAFVKNLINIRGQYELLERSIGILFDSMQTGTKIFSELNAMAIKSPFTTMELGAAAKQLSAYNIAAKDVVDTTRRLADIAAAVGVPIERLTYALGQIKSYGYLNSRDARMFANAGIPLIQNLADMYTKLEGRLVSIGDVYDRIKHKQVSFEDTLKVVNEMTDEGGRFFNFQEKAADTLVVRLANLTLAWNNMMNELGKDNTGIINSTLGGLKTIFEHWRDIDAAIWGVVKILGIAKSAQFIWLMFVRKTGIELALANTFGQKLGYTILGIATSLQALAANPLTWIAAAVVSLGYLYQKWSDLQEANESFNKSISDGAQENINSINKFFDKYRKEIDSIGSASSTDQEKMWERIREEIEKTTKNAQQYIDILEKIPDAAERVGRASGFLEQQQVLQQEAKRMADHGLFDLGGGFANDTLAKDLQEYEKTMNDVLKKYNSLEDAQKDFSDSMVAWSSGHYAVKYYNEAIEEAEKELDKFTSVLDKANIARIMGEGSDEERLANIRSFAQLIRDNFLATEEGQKISTEGQSRLNKEIDYWIAQQGVSNGLIKEQRAEIEKNRSAWENFFTYLNADQKKALDYLVSTGQTSSDEFKKIWNGAADEMKKSSLTAYEQIQSHIADLRKTAPIVIDVIYRETKESKDEAQKDFEKRFTTPDYVTNRSAEAYLAEQKRLNTIYGRFNKKTDEDMVEWEKRLGQEYQDNEKKLSDYNKMLEGYNKLSDEQKKKREAQINTVTKERDALKATQDALKEIQIWENFDFEQFKKGKKGGGSKKDFLGEAFSKVVEVTSNMQKRFKEYKQAGVDANTALEKSTQEYAKTLNGANSTLAKYGIKNTKTGLELAKMELRDLRTYYESLLVIASGVGNTKGVEALEKAIASLNVEITKTDYKKITDGLNNELNKLKNEYELAIDLDANPELGDVFADMMGLDKEQLAELPRDFEGVMNKLQGIIDEKLGKGVFNLSENLNKSSFENWLSSQGTDLDNERAKILNSYVDYANKIRQDETKKQIDEWNKLLEKYAEYEYKRKQIMETASRERETAIKKGASQEIIDAIDNREKQELAKLDFEEFQKSSDWIVATGDLANLSKAAIGGLIDELEKYKKSAKNLNPKQIKQLNSALSKLYKEQRKNNPFKAISNMLQQAKENAEQYNEEIEKTKKEIDELYAKQDQSNLSETGSEIDKLIKKYKELKQKQEDAGKIDATQWVSSINETVSAVQAAVGVFDDLAKAIGGVKTSDINRVFDTLEKGGQGAAIGAQIGSGYGAIIGAVVGLAAGIISNWSDVWSGNADITEMIEVSTRAIKRLEQSYNNLQYQIEKTAGTAEFSLRKVAIANKELQLAELERQLQLEKSRKAKNRDEDKISDLESQINDLKIEIKKASDDIINDLLGISSVGDAAENMMDAFIEALRSGEDAMAGFNESIDEMIANMLKKLLVTKFIMPRLEKIWEDIQSDIDERTKEKAAELAQIDDDFNSVLSGGDVIRMGTSREGGDIFNNEDVKKYAEKWFKAYKEATGIDEAKIVEQTGKFDEQFLEWVYEEWLKQQAERKKQLEYEMSTATNEDDIKKYAEELRKLSPEMQASMDYVESLIEELGLIKDDAKQLSALQQGLQSMSESTANSLEAYMNGVSQQVYLHSDLLVEIRDAVVGLSMDVQIGAMSQILLQLRSSYEVQMSIQSLLSGWNNPAGNAIRVEMI